MKGMLAVADLYRVQRPDCGRVLRGRWGRCIVWVLPVEAPVPDGPWAKLLLSDGEADGRRERMAKGSERNREAREAKA